MSKKKIKNFLMLNLGVFLISVSFVFIMEPNNAVYGGVQGISIIISSLFPNFGRASYFILLLNLVLLLISLFAIGKEFFVKTIYCSVMAFVYPWLLEWLMTEGLVTIMQNFFQENGLLLVLFGAIVMGVGLGLAFKAGASTGGSDIIQAVLYKYLKIPYSKSLIIVDGIIVLTGTFMLHTGTAFLENILYALVFILVQGYIMDAIVFSGFNVRAMYVITDKPEPIKDYIINTLSRGVTELPAKGGYTGIERCMLLCVLSSKEYYLLKDLIQQVDPNAFIYAARASEVQGEGFSYDSFEQ